MHGNAGVGVAENIMSGAVIVDGQHVASPRAPPAAAGCS